MKRSSFNGINAILLLPPLLTLALIGAVNIVWLSQVRYRQSLEWKVVCPTGVQVTVSESAKTLRLPVKLTGEAINLPVSLEVSAKDGSARANREFNLLTPTINFVPGQTEATIDLDILDDAIIDIPVAKHFEIALKAPPGIVLESDHIAVTIADNESLQFIVDTPKVIVNSPMELFLGVSLSRQCEGNLSAEFSTSNGTAIAGSDFEAGEGTTELKAGQNHFTIPIRILRIPLVAAEKDFWLNLRAWSADNTLRVEQRLRVVVQFPGGSTKLLVESSDVNLAPQGTEAAVVTFKLSQPVMSPVIVHVQTRDGTALAGRHYVPIDTKLTFPPGQTEVQLPIRLLPAQDADYEQTRFFQVVVTEVDGVAQDRIEKSIKLIYPPRPPQLVVRPLSVCPPPLAKQEISLPVQISKTYPWPVTVQFHTEDGTARAGRHYVGPIEGRLVFDNTTNNVIKLTVYGLQLSEKNDLSFRVVFHDPTNVRLPSDPAVTVTIQAQPTLEGNVLVLIPVTSIPGDSWAFARAIQQQLPPQTSLLGKAIWLVDANRQPLPASQNQGATNPLLPFREKEDFQDAFETAFQTAQAFAQRCTEPLRAVFVVWCSDSNPDYDAPTAILKVPDDLPLHCIWVCKPIEGVPQRRSRKLTAFFNQKAYVIELQNADRLDADTATAVARTIIDKLTQ